MHISSLPGPYGIGTLGENAYKFVDFLREAGQTYWQILPVCPTSYGDSPYQSFSTFAGNPYFIDFDLLEKDGYLAKADYEGIDWGSNEASVDFGMLYIKRHELFEKIQNYFEKKIPSDYKAFCEKNSFWLDDYALFMSVKDAHNGIAFLEWEEDIRMREPDAVKVWTEKCSHRIEYYKMLQYFFYRQWKRLKRYANAHGVKILGDVPIYVPVESADVWSNPDIFLLDEDYVPIEMSGCPPDVFSQEGQLWGNPVYNFEYMKKEGYSWWVSRFRQLFKLCDVVRVDHFRAFDSYYCIPKGAPNAKTGVWRKGPGMDFFKAVKDQLGDLPLVAEDLGDLTESVRELVRKTGYPGMKILQFAFNPADRSTYLPHNYDKNCIVYPGTHDNNTVCGWYAGDADRQTRDFFRFYTSMRTDETPARAMIRTAYASVADTAIAAMQDILELGAEARMNIPSTVGGNWAWRAREEQITGEKSRWLHKLADAFGRLPVEEDESEEKNEVGDEEKEGAKTVVL